MHNDAWNDDAAAKECRRRLHTGGKEFLSLEVARGPHDVLRRSKERGIAAEHHSDIRILLNHRSHSTQGARAHQIIIAHEENVLAARARNDLADVAVETEILGVLVIADAVCSRSVAINDRADLFPF